MHGAAAILALRDGALEAVVLDRVVLDMHGQPLLAGDKARAAGDRPALHHAVKLEAEVVMQAPRRVLLDDEAVALARAPCLPRGSGVTSNLRFLR